jgi:hypothetical protein
MHLNRLRLKNIRGFADLHLDLATSRRKPAGWTVLAGANGTGKTTVLQGIAAGALGGTNITWMLDGPERWIRFAQDEGSVALWFDGRPEDWRDPKDIQGEFKLEVAWFRAGGIQEIHPRGNRSFVHSQFLDAAALGARPRGWCLIGFGANRFAAAPSSIAEQLMKAPPRRSGVVNLFKRDASLISANNWVREVVSEFWELRADLRDSGSAPPDLVSKRNRYWALQLLLSDGLLSEDGKPAANDQPGHVTLNSWGIGVRRPEGVVPVADLGQGYESLALVVTEVLRQFSRFFGDDFMRGADWLQGGGGQAIVPHSGIVLIDEAENHLHPQLQQRLGPWLKKHFPNVQFIVTTHSPFICQAADEGCLFKVRGNGRIETVNEEVYRQVVHGSIDDAVLSDLFGLQYPWSAESQEIRHELGRVEAKLLSGQGLTDTERKRHADLLAELPDDPNTEVERLVKALGGGR